MSRTPSVRGLALLTLPAATLVAVSGLFVVRPALVLERVPELETVLGAIDPQTVVAALVVLFVVVAPTVGLAGRIRPSAPSPLVPADSAADADRRSVVDRRSSDGRSAVVGGEIDDLIERATAYDSESHGAREDARKRLVESLRPIAATAYANRAGVTADEATAAVEAGTWTDDPRAAAFLAAPSGPSIPLWLWLLDLVRTAEPFRRHLEATLEEIERLQSAATVAGPGSEPSRETETESDSADRASESTPNAEVSP